MDAMLQLELAELTDWHLNLRRPETSVVFPGPMKVKETWVPFARDLATAVQEASHTMREQHENAGRGFIVKCDGMTFRAQRMLAAGGPRFALRLVNREVRDLTALGFREEQKRLFLDQELRQKGGLVLIGGAAGVGRTTTASSMISEQLKAFGGYCLTAENPPEFQLEGFHGKGYCEQTEMVGDPHQHFAELLRCFPAGENAIFFFGEVRDGQSAAELLRIAIDGHLVISTIHAGGVAETIQRILSLARVDGEQEAKSLLAKSLRLVIHQRREDNGIRAEMVRADAALATAIRENKLGDLDEIAKRVQRPASMQP